MAIWNPFAKKKTPEELLVAGDYRGALQGLMALYKSRSDDPGFLMQIANCHLKLNEKDKARDFYIKVGEHYGDLGFFNKSVAAFKKALNITPGDRDILAKLAGYNDKVPKFMISDHFLKQANQRNSDEDQATAQADADLAASNAPAQAAEQPDAARAQEAFDTTPLPDLPEFGSSDSGDAESEPELKAPTTRSKPYEPEPVPSLETDDEEIHHLDADEEEPVQPPRAEDIQIKKTEKIIFSTRSISQKPPKEEASFDFNSLDDALDSLFAAPATTATRPLEPEPEPEEEELVMVDSDMTLDSEMDQRHWALFRTMPKDVFVDFVVALENRDYEVGSYVVRKGETGTEMYLIADGEVEVLADINGVSTRVAVLHEGDFFGEASLMTGQPRNASVRALAETSCLLLTRSDLDLISKTHPSVMASIKSIYYTRLRQNASRGK